MVKIKEKKEKCEKTYSVTVVATVLRVSYTSIYDFLLKRGKDAKCLTMTEILAFVDNFEEKGKGRGHLGPTDCAIIDFERDFLQYRDSDEIREDLEFREKKVVKCSNDEFQLED